MSKKRIIAGMASAVFFRSCPCTQYPYVSTKSLGELPGFFLRPLAFKLPSLFFIALKAALYFHTSHVNTYKAQQRRKEKKLREECRQK